MQLTCDSYATNAKNHEKLLDAFHPSGSGHTEPRRRGAVHAVDQAQGGALQRLVGNAWRRGAH